MHLKSGKNNLKSLCIYPLKKLDLTLKIFIFFKNTSLLLIKKYFNQNKCSLSSYEKV